MSTIRYIPSSLASQVVSSKILCIYASAHPATGVGAPGAAGNPKTNHWVLYCAISQAASLRIDPSPSGPNLSIVLIITKKDYLISDNAVKSLQLVTSNLTVQQFIDLIVAKNYDKYQFSAGGQGCRYWLYSVIKLLETEGHIPTKSEMTAATEALGTVWAPGGNPASAAEQTPMTKGTFYAL